MCVCVRARSIKLQYIHTEWSNVPSPTVTYRGAVQNDRANVPRERLY